MFLFLNRLRGTYSYFAKINAVILGCIFGLFSGSWIVGTLVAGGYIAGESSGWGEWVGGLIRSIQNIPEPPNPKRSGSDNGIQWLAERCTTLDTKSYYSVALFIRGLYWWIPTLLPLVLVVEPSLILLAIFGLAVWFPYSVEISKPNDDYVGNSEKKHWENAEYVYGLMQDIVFSILLISLI